jgi:PAS domain S-box-containing protein
MKHINPSRANERGADSSSSNLTGLFARPIELGKIIDELPLGVMFIDLDRRILQMNRQFEVLTGFSSDKMTGLPCWDVLRCDQCVHDCLAEEAREQQVPVTRKCSLIDRERQKLEVKVTAVPVYDTQGVLFGYMETVMESERSMEDHDSIHSQLQLGSFIGRSEQLEKVLRVVPVVAQTDSSVLIIGETGTGKDLLAEIIHRNSERAGGPFIKINCGSLPETLLESELFGHTKGAFTGAVADKMGRLRLAHNGTVFLTEIGDLPLSLQVKLLTFLDDKIVHPLGSTKGFQTDVRVFAATHRNLEQMVRESAFRQDLLYRLNVVRLHLPPLRERVGDTPLLLDHFLKHFSGRFNKPRIDFDERSRSFLLSYDYPGNVRELRNIVEYAVNVSRGERIGIDELPAYLFEQETLGAVPEDDPQVHPAASSPEKRVVNAEASWPELERKMILEALLACKGRKSDAAKRLGWSRSKLWRKMKNYGIEE